MPPADTVKPDTDADKVPPADTEPPAPPAESDEEKRQRLIKEIETADADFFNNVDVDEMTNDEIQTALDNMNGK